MAAVPLTANRRRWTRPFGALPFLIIGTPLVAFLIAASAMFESRGLPIPLVRIGTGAAGLILQTIPFMLVGAMMSQRSAHSSAPMRWSGTCRNRWPADWRWR